MKGDIYELDAHTNDSKGWSISKTDSGQVLSRTAYNVLLGGLLLYGFLANAIVCGLFAEKIADINPFLLIGGYLLSGIGGICIANISQNVVARFIGYNLLVVPSGMLIAAILPAYRLETVIHALIGTALIACVMMVAATVRPQTFEGLGTALFFSLASAVIVELALLLIFRTSNILIDIAVLIIMSVFIGYDFVKANAGVRTMNNAVAFAMDLYLDILNVFIRLLSIFGRKD